MDSSVLQRFWVNFATLFSSPPRSEEAAPPRPDIVALKNLVQLRATRAGQDLFFYIMMDTATPSWLGFKTQVQLEPGDVIWVDALLQGVGQVKLRGRIDWILRGALGYSGQLKLSLEAAEQQQWSRYLQLLLNSQRGTLVNERKGF